MEKKFKQKYLPVLIDLSDKKVLVVGAGSVATRKVQTLLDYNCQITVISPFISKKIREFESQGLLKTIERKYEKGDALTFDLVFSAIDDKQAENLIYNDCINNKIQINVADVPQLCSFIMPATVKRGYLTISIASQGKAPFLVKDVKEKIEDYFPEAYSEYSQLSAEFRNCIMSIQNLNEADKFKLISEFLKQDFLSKIMVSGIDDARKIMNEIIGKNDE